MQIISQQTEFRTLKHKEPLLPKVLFAGRVYHCLISSMYLSFGCGHPQGGKNVCKLQHIGLFQAKLLTALIQLPSISS